MTEENLCPAIWVPVVLALAHRRHPELGDLVAALTSPEAEVPREARIYLAWVFREYGGDYSAAAYWPLPESLLAEIGPTFRSRGHR